jgi:tRNA G37 N-methylase Trm5
MGKQIIVKSIEVNSNSSKMLRTDFDLNQFSKGVYLIRIMNGDNNYTHKIIKN